MESATFTSLDDVLLALVGSESEAKNAIRHIHLTYGERLTRHLNKKFDSLSTEDKEDLLQDVYVRLWKKGRNGTLNIDVGLMPLLMTMANNFAVDAIRRRDSKQRLLDSDVYRTLCEAATHGTMIGEQFRRLSVLKKAESKLVTFKDWLHTLPPKQKEVAYVLADCGQDIMDEQREFSGRIGPMVIYEEMLQRGMQPGSVMSVKRALQEIRDKFEKHLNTNDTLRSLRCP